jgi:predicted metalloendopeptidase
LNGINTQGENIADNGGIKEAYRAYQSWVERQGKPEKVYIKKFRRQKEIELQTLELRFQCFLPISNFQRLPGLKYSQNQLFWISAANVWCNKYRPESLKLRILTGVHSPGEFRVRGPFSNMKSFNEDFKCPLGTPMNPVNKCYVW